MSHVTANTSVLLLQEKQAYSIELNIEQASILPCVNGDS